jgi:hypothetical protein
MEWWSVPREEAIDLLRRFQTLENVFACMTA